MDLMITEQRVTLTVKEIQELLIEAAEQGALRARKFDAPAKDEISQREAYRRFGDAQVKCWLREGKVRTARYGDSERSTRYYSFADLMAAAGAERMIPILKHRRIR